MRPAIKGNRIFLLSPADCSGRRAQILLRDEAGFDLAVRLRIGQGVTLGEAFSFLSGLYFRGKLAYAARFGCARTGLDKALVITAGRGLVAIETPVSHADLRQFAEIPIDLDEPRYAEPLRRDILWLKNQLGPNCEVVLLGSIATPKYREPLVELLAGQLLFPSDFIGRGDMSRGGLMLDVWRPARSLLIKPCSVLRCGANVRRSSSRVRSR